MRQLTRGAVLCLLVAWYPGCVTSSGTVLKTRDTDGGISSESGDPETAPYNDTGTGPDLETDTGTGSDTDVESNTGKSTAAPPLSRNRSPLGMTPAAVEDWSSAYPFIDLMKQSRNWYDWEFGNNEFDLDENGWVRSLQPDQTAGTVFLGNENVPVIYSRVVVSYDGRGTIEYAWDAVKIEEESAPGRDVVRVSRGDHLLQITQTDPDDYLRNISIVPEGLEGNHAAGQVFNPVWLDRMQNIGALRFSKWIRINESVQENWDERPLASHRTWAPDGVPYSVMIALANRLQTDPWFTIPHLATEDFVRQLATLIEGELAGDLRVYVEHSHAPWDPRSPQYQYAVDAGAARWGDVDQAHMQWHAMKSAVLCDVFKTEVFVDDPKRVHCVLSLPIDAPQAAETTLTCPDWVREESDRAPCYLHGIDSIAISGFFDGCLQDDPYIDEILTWLDDEASGLTRGMEQLSDGRHLSGCDKDIASIGERYAHFAALATDFELGLLAFEGGQNISARGTPYQENQALIDFHMGLNRDSRMKDRYEENFSYWKEAGGRLFVHFVETESPGKYGSFGALEYITQETSPKWEALMAFSESPCWWDGC